MAKIGTGVQGQGRVFGVLGWGTLGDMMLSPHGRDIT